MPSKHKAGCTCSCGDCCPINDDYDRADSTSVGATYTEQEGDWFIEEITKTLGTFGPSYTASVLITDDEPATILFSDTLTSGDAHFINFWYGARETLLDIDRLVFRYVWGWSDDDNYWCVEWEFGDRGPWTFDACGVNDGNDAIRIIERVAGVETTHFEITGLEMRSYVSGSAFGFTTPVNAQQSVADFSAYVCVGQNGFVSFRYYDFGNPGLYDVAQGPYTMPGTGVTGFKVMEAPDGFMLQYVQRCNLSGGACGENCDTVEIDACAGEGTPPDPPDPTGCCEDLDALEVGDTAEITIYGLSYDFSAPCPGECGSGNPDYLTDLNATQTGTVVYKSDTHIIIYADTGVTTDCNGLDESAKIWVWITNIGGGECEARGEIRFGENVCSILWKTTFSAPGTCDGLVLSQDADLMDTLGLDPTNCCLQLAGDASLTVDIP